jgi:hypothetical protein
MKLFIILIVWITIIIDLPVAAQDGYSECEELIPSGYLLNEQNHELKTRPTEDAKFHVTFFQDYVYRLVACSDIEEAVVEMNIFDKKNNRLFSNRIYDYSPYWDFMFQSTMEAVVTLQIVNTDFKMGKVKLVIGYKKK